jgi:hypothetical protein
MSVAAWYRRYTAHADPATAASNLVALVVGGNGPFYPLYVLALIGWNRSGAWLTMLATPFFLAIPALSHRHPAASRVALVVVGGVNTVWCTALLGSATLLPLFLLPCIILATLLFRTAERRCALLLLSLAIAALIWLTEWPLPGLMPLSAAQASALARLNAISVATLSGFVALTLANVMQALAVPAHPGTPGR